MTPDDYCVNRTGGSGSSLHYSLLFASPEQRRAVTALYAFVREIDEIIDECTDAGVAQSKFSWWHEELLRLYNGQARHPVAQALAPMVPLYSLQQEQFLAILHGNAAAFTRTRYADFETLYAYALGTGGVAASMAATIFGITDTATSLSAQRLGAALTLTDLFQNIGRDVAHHRLNLPADDLNRFGVSESDLLARHHTPGVAALIQFEIERVLAHYDQALQQLPAVDRGKQFPTIVLTHIARTELDELRRDGYRALEHRVALTPIRKLWIALRTRFAERRYKPA